MNYFLEANLLNKSYRRSKVLKDINFSFKQGEVVGLLGENGAGKTTLMRILSGYIPPESGTVMVKGQCLQGAKVAAKKDMGYVSELNPLCDYMTVAEYLSCIASLRRVPYLNRKTQLQETSELFQLNKYWDCPIKNLSKGYRKRLGLAQALIHNPDILLLDEPTDGLDPKQKQQFNTLISNIAQYKTILISTHVVDEIKQLCNRMLILHNGEIKSDYTMTQFKRDYTHQAIVRVTGNESVLKGFARDLKEKKELNKNCFEIRYLQKKNLYIRVSSTQVQQAIKSLVKSNHLHYSVLPKEWNTDISYYFQEITNKGTTL